MVLSFRRLWGVSAQLDDPLKISLSSGEISRDFQLDSSVHVPNVHVLVLAGLDRCCVPAPRTLCLRGLAEWLALTYGDQGIKVSVLCPQAVRTEMTRGHEDHVAAIDGMMEPEPVAEACVQTIRAESFLVLPHPEVLGYMRKKTENYDRWIGGMRKLNRRFGGFES